MRAAGLRLLPGFYRRQLGRRLTVLTVILLEEIVMRLDRWADQLTAGLLGTEEPATEHRVAQSVRVLPHSAGIFVGPEDLRQRLDPARALDEFLKADLTLPRELQS